MNRICVSPHEPWAATGQKDPKDEPGKGEDLPKIWVWNYLTMEPVQLIDNVCWGKITRLGWSKRTNILYCICGDIEQSLKAYDPDDFDGKRQPTPLIDRTTTKELILGFVINPKPNKAYYDEFIIFGKRKFCHCAIQRKDGKMTRKIKAISIMRFQKEGEKQFGCAEWLPDGRYIVGAKSGAVYVCRDTQCVSILKEAHSRSVGCLVLTKDERFIISAGHDRLLKRWKLKLKKKNRVPMDDENGAAVLTQEEQVETPRATESNGKRKKKTPSLSQSSSGGTSPMNKKRKGRKNGVIGKKELSPEEPKKKKKEAAGMVETWSYEVNMAGTDYILQPRAMVYHDETGRLYVGSKTNQIMKFEMKEEDASVVVDGHDGQIWGLCTHPELPLFATGGYDNAVKIWDANTMKCIITYEFELEQGDKKGHEISCGHWSNDGNVIVFGTENTSCLCVFSWDTEKMDLKFQQIVEIPPKNKNAEVEPVAYLRFSDDSSTLGAAHMDSNLYIYSVEQGPGRVFLAQWPMPLGHIAAPINIQFSEDGKMVKTFTRDYEVAHWKLDYDRNKGKFCATIPDPDEVKWADDPLIAGWDVEGLYQKGWDGTDLNDATLTSDGRLVATGDDYGNVRLHNFPSTDQKTCHAYGGHAEFVVGVEFLRDDSQLISCGGADMAIFQWKLHKKQD